MEQRYRGNVVFCMDAFFMGHGHMWFLLDLLGFYLLLPVLWKVCEDIRVLGYFLLLWVIVRYVVTTMIPDFGRGLLLAGVTSMHLHILTGFIGYFMGGYFLLKVDIPKWFRFILYICGAGAIGFTIVKTLYDCRTSQLYDERWFSPSNVNVLIFSIAVFVFFKYITVPKKISDSKLIPVMAKSTFFVYMIHPFFIEKLGLMGIKVISYPVYLSIPILSVVIFAASMLGGWIVAKIPVIGKWICRV